MLFCSLKTQYLDKARPLSPEASLVLCAHSSIKLATDPVVAAAVDSVRVETCKEIVCQEDSSATTVNVKKVQVP